MSNENINDETKKKRKKFTAIFDRYEFTAEPKKIHLKDVRDENGEIVKKYYFLKDAILDENLLGHMIIGEEVIEFEADVKIMNPSNVRRVR